MYISTYIRIWIHIRTGEQLHIHRHACINWPTHIDINILMHIHAYIHTGTHACMQACIHASAHACMYTYIPTSVHSCIHTGLKLYVITEAQMVKVTFMHLHLRRCFVCLTVYVQVLWYRFTGLGLEIGWSWAWLSRAIPNHEQWVRQVPVGGVRILWLIWA